ncbi:ROK family protein [Clostridium lundense]|uniref:ROK family protein n=1 Tax=Clostridium lundense TaxID=319475 RepID=UPI0004894462|nr:ROK family protein [Clostridium lundense]
MNRYIGQPQTIKKLNVDLIKDVIKNNGPISKPEIARITKLSLATVNKLVDVLANDKVVNCAGVGISTGGRRAQLYEINGDIGYVLALNFKDNYYICAISNVSGEIKHRCKMPIKLDTKQLALEDTFKAIDYLIDICEKKHEIKAVGIGVPGVVNGEGYVSNIPNIPEWEGINLKEILENKYDMPIFVENDVKLTTLGVYYNNLKEECNDMVYVYIGKGIGSGIIINGKLHKGWSNFAGELSYIYTEDYIKYNDSKMITMGNFESIVCNAICAIKKKNNNEDFLKLKELLIKNMANAFINIICLINPQIIAINGDMIDELLIIEIKKEIGKYIYTCNIPKFIIIEDSDEPSLMGVINMCLSCTISNFTLLNIKGV